MAEPERSDRFPIVGVGIPVALSAFLRGAYVLAQPSTDPSFARPMLDGMVYFEWASALVAGNGGVDGAYYLAPGYAWFLAAVLGLFGSSAMVVYGVQHVVALVGTAALARTSWRIAGPPAAVATAWLSSAYHPWLFFASRPLGDVLGVTLLALAILLATRRSRRSGIATGMLSGALALVRPNLVLAPLLWALRGAVARPRSVRPVLIVVALAVVLAPVAVRNRVESGHWVPVSSNAGLTLYHGNGPGAIGVFTPVAGMSGRVERQRAEATALAQTRSTLELDAVEADRWWGRQAVRVRVSDPLGTVALVARRISLTVANTELGLDYAPGLDRNPFARLLVVPFAVLLALGVAAPFTSRRTARTSDERDVWLSILACAITPVVFYVSSRYRLPLALLMSVPAGVTVARFLRSDRSERFRAAAIVIAVGAISMLVPTGSVRIPMESGAWTNQAGAWLEVERDDRARECLDRALALDPRSVPARYQVGLMHQRAGRFHEAETAYREALALDPRHAESAGNLSSLLVGRGETGESILMLRRVLESRPLHEPSWTNLIVALTVEGRAEDAWASLERARALGVAIDAELVDAVDAARRTAQDPASDP